MMLRNGMLAVLLGVAALALAATASVPADAGQRHARNGPQVKGFVARRGGYSYTPEQVINTYGDSRTKFGGATSLRDPNLDRQTESGPFDHGFFFDSATGPHGGDAPYMN